MRKLILLFLPIISVFGEDGWKRKDHFDTSEFVQGSNYYIEIPLIEIEPPRVTLISITQNSYNEDFPYRVEIATPDLPDPAPQHMAFVVGNEIYNNFYFSNVPHKDPSRYIIFQEDSIESARALAGYLVGVHEISIESIVERLKE